MVLLECTHHQKGRSSFLDGTWFGLYEREALATDTKVAPEGNGFESFAHAHNVCSESEADEVISLVLEAGGTLVKDSEKALWGGYKWFTSKTRMIIYGR